jgi:hypothetical protein
MPFSASHVTTFSLVEILLRGCRPSAILFAVVAVVVFTVDSVLGHLPLHRRTAWTLAHVGEEVLELVPPLADLDPTPAVVREYFVFGVVAAVS